MLQDEENQFKIENNEKKGYVKIDWGRQGGVFLAYIIVLLGYYGIVVNIGMVNNSLPVSGWYSYSDLYNYSVHDRHWIFGHDDISSLLFWTYEAYIDSFFLPLILLFVTCFLLTYKEDIPHYGIKASIWLVPLIIIEAFIFYAITYGFNIVPIIYQFGNWRGYLHICVLIAITLSGAISGMKVKQLIKSKRDI
ncbi:MAG: hypothetical protein ACFE8G_06165 [Candidatus Hermodarchaeota archaeon]